MPIKPIIRKDTPYWWIRGTHKKVYVYESTGILHTTKRAPDEVWDIIRKIEKEIEDEQIHGKGYNITFEQAAQVYLRNGGSPRFLQRIVEQIGDMRLRDLSQSELESVMNAMYGNCTPQTKNRQFITPVNAVCNANGHTSIMKRIKAPKIKTTQRAHSYEDAWTFIRALSKPTAQIMFFLFYTGCRPKEAINLRGQDINIEDRWITLRDTKTGARGIPMHECLIELLAEIREQDGFKNSKGAFWPDNSVYTKTGRVIAQRGGQFDTPLKTAYEKTGIKIRAYDARHTVSTYLIHPGGVDQSIKDQILGHGGGVSSDYIHLPRQALINAINVLPTPEGFLL